MRKCKKNHVVAALVDFILLEMIKFRLLAKLFRKFSILLRTFRFSGTTFLLGGLKSDFLVKLENSD